MTPKPPKKSLPLWHVPSSVVDAPGGVAIPASGAPLTRAAAPPRSLRLVLGRSPSGARYLLAASLWPALGCAAAHEGAGPRLDGGVAAPPDAAPIDAGPGFDSSWPVDGSVVIPLHDAAIGAPDAARMIDPRYPFDVRAGTGPSCGWGQEIIYAELPPEGVPAEIQQLCMQPATELVRSGWAARMVVDADPRVATRARGVIEVAPELVGRVLDTPVLRVDAQGFEGLMISSPTLIAQGRYEVQLSWQGTTIQAWDDWWHMDVTILFDVACAPGDAGAAPDAGSGARRGVEVKNELYLCNESGRPRWISSGEACTTCAIIAEMAPSPIVPMPRASELPLEHVLRLNLRTIAVIGRDLLVYAEHDGGADGAEYSWQPSAGDVQPLAKDVVLWRIPESCREPQLLQVVVESECAAAVASMRFQGGVA